MSEEFTRGYALLIGLNENYVDEWALPDVVKDIKALEEVLTHPQRCAYPKDHVKTITGQDATRQGILDGLEWLQNHIRSDASGNATAVVYYTGHGWCDESSASPDFYFIPYDIREGQIGSRGLRAVAFAEAVERLRPQRLLVVLDCCHAGGMGVKGSLFLPVGYVGAAVVPSLLMRGEKIAIGPRAKGMEALAQGSGRAVLSSSTGEQRSYMRRDGKMSIFTYHLIEALIGHARPQEEATEVLVSDVMSYVWRHVPHSARADWNAKQEPDYQVSGNFPIALLLGGAGLSKGQLPPNPLGTFAGENSGAIAQEQRAMTIGEGELATGGTAKDSITIGDGTVVEDHFGNHVVKNSDVVDSGSALSSQQPIQLDWPAGMSHEPEEDELLRQLYEDELSCQLYPGAAEQSIGRVIVKGELASGFGGARILVVIPEERNAGQQAPRVVKLGPRAMLEAERNKYDSFVKERMPTAVAIRKRFVAQGTKAAIEYVFVGGRLLEPVRDLIDYYQEHPARQITKVLGDLADHLGQYWYHKGSMGEEFAFVEYGPHLPSHVSLELRPQSKDRLWVESGPIPKRAKGYRLLAVENPLHDQDLAKQEDLVQIEGLEVVRIKPWAATLVHRVHGQVRVRVEYEEQSGIAQQLRVGQHVAVRGKVIATRHGLLKTVIKTAFDRGKEVAVSLDDDQVLAGLGRRGSYPNPLKRYPDLLNGMLRGHRSIIHGDLHLRNVLVDRDGRPWLIDFGRVREGHTLFDFIKLETYLRLDVLSKAAGFTLAEHARFEEALADATCYGLWTARLPTNRELLKAFRVIRAIRRLGSAFLPPQEQAETYFRCLLLYNLAVLKYAYEATLAQDGNTEEQTSQLQAARLCFIAAAVQGRWLENPPRPRLRFRGVLERGREWLVERLDRLTKPALYLLIAVLMVTLLGLGYSVHHSWRVTRRARAESLNSQCVVYLQQGDLETAGDLCLRATEADSRYPTSRHNLGMVYYLQGDLDRAIEQFREATTLDSSYASPHYELGRVYDDLGRVEDALSELWRAVELDPTMSEAYNEIGYILNREGRYTEAKTVLEGGLEEGRERNPPALLKNLGRAYLGLGEATQAVQHLEVAAARLSHDDALYVETHRLLAQAYEAKGDIDKALRVWQGPLQDEPDALENIQRLSSPVSKKDQPGGGGNA